MTLRTISNDTVKSAGCHRFGCNAHFYLKSTATGFPSRFPLTVSNTQTPRASKRTRFALSVVSALFKLTIVIIMKIYTISVEYL
jgi:hypothetical protein